MSIYNLGRVLPIFTGEYDNNKTYNNLDVVLYNGSSYVALNQTQGNLPTDTNHWAIVALAGTLSPEQVEYIQNQVIQYVQGQGYVIDSDYVHTDNNFTDAEKTKLDGIDLSTKQDVLESGINIMTINHNSILGSGNLDIQTGGGGTSDYTQLSNLPSINGTTLTGNVNLATPEQLNSKQDTLVSGTNIATINGNNLLNGGDITIEGSEDVTQINYKLEGITAEKQTLTEYTPATGAWNKQGIGVSGSVWSRIQVQLPEGIHKIVFNGVKLRSGLTDNNIGYAIGHYNNGSWVTDFSRQLEINTEDVNVLTEYTIDDINLTGNTYYFRTEVRYGSNVLTPDLFYCYFYVGTNVEDTIKANTSTPMMKLPMLGAIKALGITLETTGSYFYSDASSQKTWMVLMQPGETVQISENFGNNFYYVYFGLANDINVPPRVCTSREDMEANFPFLKRGYISGKWVYEYTNNGSNPCYLWCCHRKSYGTPNFKKIVPITKPVQSLTLGSCGNLRWSGWDGTNTNYDATTVDDVYAVYDSLITNNPLWIREESPIGTATLDDTLEIKHYVVGYQAATVKGSYTGSNIIYNDNGVNHDMPHIVINAGIHGNEKAAVFGLAEAIKQIIESTEPWAVFIKTNFVIDIIPVLSPYTFNNNTRTMTVDGVSLDPNRDYSTFKLNESKAIRDFMMNNKKAICFIDCHNTNETSGTDKRMFVSTQEGSFNTEPVLELSTRLSSMMSQLIPSTYDYPDDPKVWGYLSKIDAKTSVLAYFVGELNRILAFTLETPRNTSYTLGDITSCTSKAAVLMTTLIENIIPATTTLYNNLSK